MTFVIDESQGRLGSSIGVSTGDFLLPISSCADPKHWQNLSTTRHIRFQTSVMDQCFANVEERLKLHQRMVPPDVSPPVDELAALPAWRRANLEDNRKIEQLRMVWWRGMCMHWMLRPNTDMTRWLEEYANAIGYPSRPHLRRSSHTARTGRTAVERLRAQASAQDVVVAVHIRGGDKASETGWKAHLEEFGPLKYFEQAFELRNAAMAANERLGFVRWPVPTILFLATDDENIAKAAESTFEQLLRDSWAPKLKFSSAPAPFRIIFDKDVMRHFSMAGFLGRKQHNAVRCPVCLLCLTFMIL